MLVRRESWVSLLKGNASLAELKGAETEEVNEAHEVVLVELSWFGGDTPSSLGGGGWEEEQFRS